MNTNRIFKTFIAFFLVCANSVGYAQQTDPNSYYDSSWIPTIRDSAYYACNFQPYEDVYVCKCYWASSNNLKSIAIRTEASVDAAPLGLQLSYYQNRGLEDSIYYYGDGRVHKEYHFHENGRLADSIFYGPKGHIDSGFTYFSDGKLRAVYHYDTLTKIETSKVLNEHGEEIKGAAYRVEANFPGGEAGWKKFLMQRLDANVPVENGARAGIYKVIVRFTVQKDGTIKNIIAETGYGYGMEAAAIKLISNSPRWNPAILLGEKVIAFRRQPITFYVSE